MKIVFNKKIFVTYGALFLLYVPPLWLRLLNAWGIVALNNVSAITRNIALFLDIFLLFLLLPRMFKLSKEKIIVVFFLIITAIFILGRDNGYNLAMLSNFGGRVLPFLLVYMYANDNGLFLAAMTYISKIVVVGAILFPFTKAYSTSMIVPDWQWNYMSYGYNTICCWTALIWQYLNQKKTSIFLLSSILTIEYICYSTRFMLVCVSLIILISVAINETKIKKLQLTILGGSLIIVFIIFNQEIFRIIGLILNRIGVNSRTFQLFSDRSLALDSGRNVIWQQIIPHLNDNSLFGKGIGYDRLLTGNYSHNMFLELFLSFGYFMGAFFCVLILLFIIKIFRTKDKDIISVFIIMTLPGYIILQLSDSVFSAVSVYMTVLIFLSCLKKAK